LLIGKNWYDFWKLFGGRSQHMINKIFKQFFLKQLLVLFRRSRGMDGFTLLELLVSLIMASIIISTLLGFLVSLLDTDRKEQAKVESQEEIQSALNYISDDLQQSVYIYDADGLYLTNSSLTPAGVRIIDQIPNGTISGQDLTPVLVFWKRKPLGGTSTVTSSGGTPDVQVRCLPFLGTVTPCVGPDTFVYSLVAYYLVKDATPNGWSNSARIARWEISDGVTWSCFDGKFPIDPITPSVCGNTNYKQREDADPAVSTTIDSAYYVKYPDPNFLRFPGSGTLSTRMNAWRMAGAFNITTNPLTTLVDYIDDTDYTPAQDVAGPSPIKIGIVKNVDPSGTSFPVNIPSKNNDCDRADVGVGVGLKDSDLTIATRSEFAQRIPPDFNNPVYNPTGFSSFYACVNSAKVTARVFIRGNALTRLESNKNFRLVTDDKRASFVPTANVRAFGRSGLGLSE